MSDRIRRRWEVLSKEHRKALIPYITPEFPVRGATLPVLQSLAKQGSDFIEVGVPFSDPIADGPTIQGSSEVALRNGATIPHILAAIREFRASSEIPVLLMGYVNPILRYGVDRFMQESAAAGVDGLILPDVPPEESSDISASMKKAGLSMVCLIAPTSSDERIRTLDNLSTDFSYCVSLTGVSGARDKLGSGQNVESFLRRVQMNAKKKYVVGFGISSAAHVGEVWRMADGAVVGSALIKAMSGAGDPAEAAAAAGTFLSSLRPNGASL